MLGTLYRQSAAKTNISKVQRLSKSNNNWVEYTLSDVEMEGTRNSKDIV